jgi:undecaprenyl-diphosphatase
MQKIEHCLDRIERWDAWLCERFSRANRYKLIEQSFRFISRLGDGIFWYLFMLALPCVYGNKALGTTLQMILTGITCTLLYKFIKETASRPRPNERNPAIPCPVPPLDQYSFPSGHTLHAVAFSTIAVTEFHSLAWVLVPFTLLIAFSRVILGLHYPSDVLAGALIGALVAGVSLCF